MTPTLFKTYPTDITQHVIDAMTPSIEAEIKRVHEAVEAAKAKALKEALKKFNADVVANDPLPVPPTASIPPVPPKPTKRRTSWDGMTAAERSAVVTRRWLTRKANATKTPKNKKPTAKKGSLTDPTQAIRYASVCSGVEGLSLAWEPLGGFEPVFFSEIAAFPSAVLAKRWSQVEPALPNVQHDGKPSR